MFKTKVKGILLSFILVLVSTLCFACGKEKTNSIQVESIGFKDSTIELLVGESYTPTITVLPNNASKKGYKLISEDIAIVSVNGGTITALKEGLGIKLKVVSVSNELINDMVTVNVYAKPINMQAPTNLSFDGEKFSFDRVDGASSYKLKINDTEIDIGNNTEYLFANLIGKVDALYDTQLNVSVKAIGDNRIHISSQYSEIEKFIKVSEVKSAYIQNEKLYIKELNFVTSYNVQVLKNDIQVFSKSVNNKVDDCYVLDISTLSDSVNGAEYKININANCNGIEVDGYQVFGSNGISINYAVLGQVKNVKMNNYVITWDTVKNADNYDIEIYTNTGLYASYEGIEDNILKIDTIEISGDYWCKVLANSNQDKNVLTGKEFSTNVEFSVLDTPTISFNEGVVNWSDVNAEGYLVYVEDSGKNVVVNEVFVSDNYYDVSNYSAGSYSIKVASCGNGTSTLNSIYTTLNDWTVLSAVTDLNVKNKIISWKDADVNSLNKYKLILSLGASQLLNVDLSVTDLTYANDKYQYQLPASVGSGDYKVQVTSIGEDNVFDSVNTIVDYSILPQVTGLSMNNYVTRWTAINKATSYTMNLYKVAVVEPIKTYNINSNMQNVEQVIKNLATDYSGGYYYNVVANIDDTLNVDSENLVSSNYEFNVLKPTIITAENGTMSWVSDNGDDVTGYAIGVSNGIINLDSQPLSNDKTSFTIAEFEEQYKFILQMMGARDGIPAGKYDISITATGDNSRYLNSPITVKGVTLLDKVRNVNIDSSSNNIKLLWQNLDSNTLQKYVITIKLGDTIETINLSSSDLGTKFNYDEDSKYYSLDLNTYDFNVGNHEITITSIGNNAEIFDSKVTTITLIKPNDASITAINNKVFSVNNHAQTTYEIKLYNASDVSFETPIDSAISGNNIVVDELEAGSYIARVYAYGNDSNVLDANNADSAIFEFEKLQTPTITLNDTLISVSEITNAVSYKLITNGSANAYTAAYDVAGISAGEYIYTCQAIGNNTNILDSEISTESIKIKKLATPSANFDKNTKTFTIVCNDSGIVENYSFKLYLNETDKVNTILTEMQVDCSSAFADAGEYNVNLVANCSSLEGFDLVLNSNEFNSLSVTKLTAESTVKVEGRNIVITPTTSLGTGEFSASVRIVKGVDKITITDFAYQDKKFVKALYDTNFDILGFDVDDTNKMFENSGDYEIYITIDKNDNLTLASNEAQTDNLIVIDEINNVVFNNDQITFNQVDNVESYYMVITLDEVTKYIDITNKYTINENINIITIETIKQLMELNSIEYLTETEYKVAFIGIPTNNSVYIPNKCNTVATFKFLNQAEIEVDEQELTESQDWDEVLSVKNNVDANVKYVITFTQSGTSKEIDITTTNTTYLLSQLTEFEAGQINIAIKAVPINTKTTQYASSELASFSVNKLSSSNVSVNNGSLTWAKVSGARQYKLFYANAEGELGSHLYKVLKEGDTNLTMSGNNYVYDFQDLDAGMHKFYVQADSELTPANWYINSGYSTPLENVIKLAKTTIGVEDGVVKVEFDKASIERTNRFEITLDNQPVDLIIYQASDNVVVVDGGDRYISYIKPTALLKYTSIDELTAENLKIRLKAVTDGRTLDSSIDSKDLYGLLRPEDLTITTSIADIDAKHKVIEKITWTNPTANSNYVSNYTVLIEYTYRVTNDETGEVEEITKVFDFTSNNTYLNMPTSGICDGETIQFKAGDYRICVIANSNDDDCIVYSHASEIISISILPPPTNLGVVNGNIVWTGNYDTERYFVRVYNMSSANQELIASTQTGATTYDLTTLPLGDTAMIYGVTIQALHSSPDVLASEECEMVEMIRLPQAKGYYVKDGVLYVRLHKFFTTVRLDIDNRPLVINNNSELLYSYLEKFVMDNISIFDMEGSIRKAIIKTYTDDSYYIDVPYVYSVDNATGNKNYDLRTVNPGEHSIDIKLYGNSSVIAVDMLNIRWGMISGHTLQNATNLKASQNIIHKLATPLIDISDTTRGIVEVRLPADVSYPALEYFKSGETALKGVNLYKVDINTNENTTIYIAKIVDSTLFNNSTSLIQANGLKYFKYNGRYFNVMDNLDFNLNVGKYYYYSSEGEYTYIDLSQGGKILVQAKLIGDDTYYVSSNDTNIIELERYDSLSLSVANGGLKWEHKSTEGNVYMIELTNNNKKYSIVLYNPEINGDVSSILGNSYIYDTYTTDNIKQEIVIDAETGEERTQNYLVYNNLANILNGVQGININQSMSFSGLVKLYYVNETNLGLLLAQGNPSATVTMLAKPNVQINTGELTWNKVYITEGASRTDINDYILYIENVDTDEEYSITLHSSNYRTNGDTITYKLQPSYNKEAGGNFEISSSYNYIFKVMSLAVDSTSYVNSVIGQTDEIGVQAQVTNLKMENGVLVWSNSTSNKVEVSVSFVPNDKEVIYSVTDFMNSFDLPRSSVLDITGTSVKFNSTDENGELYNYNISIRVIGDNSTLSSFATVINNLNRLPNIDESTIRTENGVLKWNYPDNLSSKFSVTYQLDDQTTGVVNDLGKEFDFAGLSSENIKFTITAKCNDMFQSFTAPFNATYLDIYKLQAPINIKYDNNNKIITWAEVTDNLGNAISGYNIKVVDTNGTHNYYSETNSWQIAQGIDSEFSLSIQSVASSENIMTVNSEFSDELKLARPNAVEQNSFIYKEDKFRFEFKAIEGEQTVDKYYIIYDYHVIGETYSQSKRIEINESEIREEQKYYYYYPKAIGEYRNIDIQVVRAGGLASELTRCYNQQGEQLELIFNWFDNGDGDEYPYKIANETQLRNINKNEYFLSANYVITKAITLESINSITTSTQIFSGTITASSSCGISAQSSQLYHQDGYVGLFHKTANATFTDIYLSGFAINGYLNKSTTYLGCLVAYAENTTFDNIHLEASTITVIKDDESGITTNSVSVYIGGVVGYAVNCTVKDSNINLTKGNDKQQACVTLSIKGNGNTILYVGGVAGVANGGTYEKNDVQGVAKYTLTGGNSGRPNVYTGRCVGSYITTQPTTNENTGSVTVFKNNDEQPKVVDDLGNPKD